MISPEAAKIPCDRLCPRPTLFAAGRIRRERGGLVGSLRYTEGRRVREVTLRDFREGSSFWQDFRTILGWRGVA